MWQSGDIDTDSLFNSLVRDASPGLYPSADSLADYARMWAQRWGLRVQTHSNVTSITARQAGTAGAGFELTVQRVAGGNATGSDRERVHCQWVVVATGLFRPHLPDVPGLAEHSLSYNEMPTTGLSQPAFYANKTVAIIGGGNAAFETWKAVMADAAYVHIHAPSALKLAWESHYVGHVRSVNAAPLDNYLLKSQDVLHLPSPLGLSRTGARGYIYRTCAHQIPI